MLAVKSAALSSILIGEKPIAVLLHQTADIHRWQTPGWVKEDDCPGRSYGHGHKLRPDDYHKKRPDCELMFSSVRFTPLIFSFHSQAPATLGQEPLEAQLPSGIQCTGGSTGDKCLVVCCSRSMTTQSFSLTQFIAI